MSKAFTPLKTAFPVAIGLLLIFGFLALLTKSNWTRNKVASEPPEDREAYPLILYGVPNTDKDLRRTRELGFTHIYRSGNGFAGNPDDPERMDDIRTYLDRAQAHGLKVAFCLDGHRRLRKGEQGIEEMRAIVRQFKNHPALGFWYLYDEPNLPSPKTKKAMLAARLQEEGGASDEEVVKELVCPPGRLLPAYEMVKQEAPGRPVILMMAITNDGWWRDAWKEFHASYDIISFDTYPVYATPFPEAPLDRVTSWMDRYTKGTDKPVMPCLQTFNWNTFSRRVERAREAGNTEVDQWRYPNLEELRYWNFSSLIQGAPGAIYYTYGGPDPARRPPASWLDRDLKTTTRELARFTALAEPHSLRRITLPGRTPVLCAAFRSGKGRFIVVANGSGTGQQLADADLLSELNGSTVQAWDFTRATALHLKEGSVVGIDLQPWEVQVWQVQ
ncbi:MAG TPA: hypothetical protein VNQ90_06410 [Chthoniobacteraceae bacterium]|nr:hypothetical protein [Chthoniobacteraceae bacterium]